jgi:hypothetical protein
MTIPLACTQLEELFDCSAFTNAHSRRLGNFATSDGLDLCVDTYRQDSLKTPVRYPRQRAEEEAEAQRAAVQAWAAAPPAGQDRVLVAVDPGIRIPLAAAVGRIVPGKHRPKFQPVDDTREQHGARMRHARRQQQAPAGERREFFPAIAYTWREHQHVSGARKLREAREKRLREAPRGLQAWQSAIPTGRTARKAGLVQRLQYCAPRILELIAHYDTWCVGGGARGVGWG